MDYLILSIVKDEEEFLPRLLDAIKGQVQKPVLWLIINDGSGDGTTDILNKVNESWITVEHLEDLHRAEHYPNGLTMAPSNHLGKRTFEGFKKLQVLTKDAGIQWQALSVLDGDAIPEPNYYSELIHYLSQNKELGIISGQMREGEPVSVRYHRSNIPWEPARLYRRSCLEQIGGPSPTISPLSVELVLARNQGFRTILIPTTSFLHLRPTGSRGGYYRGYKITGQNARWLGLSLTFALAKSTRLFFSTHPSRGLGYLIGFLKWNGSTCQIPEVRAAYRHRWHEWWRSKSSK